MSDDAHDPHGDVASALAQRWEHAQYHDEDSLMSYNRRRNMGWARRDERAAQRAIERGEIPREAPVVVQVPTGVVHHGAFFGFKEQLKYTRCGIERTARTAIHDQPAQVTCPRCLDSLRRDAALAVPAPTEFDQVRRG